MSSFKSVARTAEMVELSFLAADNVSDSPVEDEKASEMDSKSENEASTAGNSQSLETEDIESRSPVAGKLQDVDSGSAGGMRLASVSSFAMSPGILNTETTWEGITDAKNLDNSSMAFMNEPGGREYRLRDTDVEGK